MVAPTVNSRTFTYTVVIALRGHVDETASHQLRHELINALLRRRYPRTVIDFTRATSLDPAAVGTLIAAHDTACDMHLTLTFRNPSPSIADELADLGLPTNPAPAATPHGRSAPVKPLP